MNLPPEKQVPDSELCERLKELEYPQDGAMFYFAYTTNEFSKNSYYTLEYSKHITQNNKHIAAPTVPEMFRFIWGKHIYIYKHKHKFKVWHQNMQAVQGSTLANAIAKLLLQRKQLFRSLEKVMTEKMGIGKY